MAKLGLEIHWLDDVRMAELFLRLQFFFVKRSGPSRAINLLIHLVALPLYVLNLLTGLPILGVIALFTVFKIPLKRRDGSSPAVLAKLMHLIKYVDRYSPFKILSDRVEWLRALCDNRRSVVYLRPFRMDNRMAVLPPDVPQFEIERLIQNAMKGIGPMFALGDRTRSSARYAARIQTQDNRWQSEVTRLLENSGFIIIIPENTDGTLWEIDRILENPSYLAKSVFMNISSAGRDHPYWARERTIYTEDDGATFLNTLKRIGEYEPDSFPPPEQIVCAFLANDQLHLICSQKFNDSGLWAFSAKTAMYLKLQPKTLESLAEQTRPSNELPVKGGLE